MYTVDVTLWIRTPALRIYSGQSGSVTGFSRVFRFSPFRFIQQFFYTHISIIWYRRCTNFQLAAPWAERCEHI